jgi:hypothetical protein
MNIRILSLEVPKSKHPVCIGKGGCTVRHIQDIFGVRVTVPRGEDPSTSVILQGENLGAAQSYLEQTVGLKLSSEPLTTASLDVPAASHGILIGKGGATLRDLESRFNVALILPGRDAAAPSAVTAQGAEASLTALHTEIERILHREVACVMTTGMAIVLIYSILMKIC